jgi:N-acyl-D-amino-acid deacylase
MSLGLVIKNGKIVDGLGNPWFRIDIGIKDGIMTEIGSL